jgi:hypothetical protein
MNISRRLALGCASAFAVTGGTTQLSLASIVKSASTTPLPGNVQTTQRFLELLIHRDESHQSPYTAMISIAAPDTGWFGIYSLDESKYRVLNHDYKKHGYRLRRVSAFNTRDGICYSALWELASGPAWESTHAMTLAKFESARNDFKQSGYRMTHIDARVNYAAIWERGDNTTQQVFSALTLLEFEQQLATQTTQGFRPVRISATGAGGAPSFAAIFEKASAVGWQSKHQLSASDFFKTDNAAKAQGYRLTDASGYMLGGKANFSGIWDKP